METTDLHHPPQQDVDDELELELELEEGLIARRKSLNQTPISTPINGGFTTNNVDPVDVSNGEHHDKQQDQQDAKVVKDFIQQNCIKVVEDEEEKEKQHNSEYSVYYDTDKGIWKCRICPWDTQGRTCLPRPSQHPRWHSHTLANVKTVYGTEGNGQIHEPENIKKSIENHDNENGGLPAKQNGEHQVSKTDLDNKTESSDIEVIKDGDDEITEYDVETVIKKQDTHDLFCPNCNSCITKRVILRKRKRRIPVPGEDAKRSKPQTPNPSELNVVLEDSNENRATNEVDSRLDDHQREPDVFRCLSCFSIFMPTGDGFKLFRLFGNKRIVENNEQSQKEVPVKKSWFSNFLRSEKGENNVTSSNDLGTIQRVDAGNNVRGVSSPSSNQKSSMKEADSHTSNGTTDLEKDQLQTDTVISDTNGKIATDAKLTAYHIEKESDSKSENPGRFVVKPPLSNVETAENPVSPLQHDGLKLLVPPDVGSLIIDNSNMNQDLDVTVQTTSAGLNEKGTTEFSFSLPASKPGQLNMSSQMNSQGLPLDLSLNGKEQIIDTDSVSVQATDVVQNNVEILLEEPLKANKDVLTGRQMNLIEDLKNIERIKGDDMIITIESKQPDTSAIQRPPETTVETGTSALQQAVGQGGVTMATGGGRSLDLEVVKSIVYGGLIELITSLSVVSSAAGGNAATINVLALGLANIFGGLFVITHDLWDLKDEKSRKREDRYQQLLGQRANFPIHMAVSLLSYLVFGFLPPLVYGFSFRESNDKDLKLLMVAAASIVCVMILAAGKAYVQTPRKSYFKTISYYVMFGFMVSGASYVCGGLIIKLLEKVDIFHDGSVQNLRIHGASSKAGLASS